MKILHPTLPSPLSDSKDFKVSLQTTESVSEVSVVGQVLTGLNLKQANLSESKINKTDFSQVKIERFDVLECEFNNCNFTASKFVNASWHVVRIEGARCSGMQVTNGSLKNVLFSNCKLEFVNFRFSSFDSIIFQDCVLDDVDFNDTKLKNVEFIDCTINKISFMNGKLTNVDLSKSQIEGIQGAHSLKGATVSYDQVIQLAPLLAAELGIKIK